jgi:hypothetical protein
VAFQIFLHKIAEYPCNCKKDLIHLMLEWKEEILKATIMSLTSKNKIILGKEKLKILK